MNTTHSGTKISDELYHPAIKLGAFIRERRKEKGWTLAELAEKIGRRREWLNRIELGYSENGEHKPPSKSDIEALMKYLEIDSPKDVSQLRSIREEAEAKFNELTLRSTGRKIDSVGKLTRAEIIIGESQMWLAAKALIEEQHSDAIIRNTGIWSLAPIYLKHTSEWHDYRKSIGKFLKKHQNSVLKRVEFVGTNEHLKLAQESDKWLGQNRDLAHVHNAKVKFFVKNPLLLDVLIGQREAILAIPQSTAHNRSSMAILVRDKMFVEALRVWFDEVLWEYPVKNKEVEFTNFTDSFNAIKKMYGFEDTDQ